MIVEVKNVVLIEGLHGACLLNFVDNFLLLLGGELLSRLHLFLGLLLHCHIGGLECLDIWVVIEFVLIGRSHEVSELELVSQVDLVHHLGSFNHDSLLGLGLGRYLHACKFHLTIKVHSDFVHHNLLELLSRLENFSLWLDLEPDAFFSLLQSL